MFMKLDNEGFMMMEDNHELEDNLRPEYDFSKLKFSYWSKLFNKKSLLLPIKNWLDCIAASANILAIAFRYIYGAIASWKLEKMIVKAISLEAQT